MHLSGNKGVMGSNLGNSKWNLCLFLFLLMVTLDGIGKVNRNHWNQYGQGGTKVSERGLT